MYKKTSKSASYEAERSKRNAPNFMSTIWSFNIVLLLNSNTFSSRFLNVIPRFISRHFVNAISVASNAIVNNKITSRAPLKKLNLRGGGILQYKFIRGCAPQGFLLRSNSRNLIRY